MPPVKCNCFICGEIGHYTRNCTQNRVKKERLNMYQQLELPEEVDIVSVASNDTAKDNDICSIFRAKDTNFTEENNLLEFSQIFGDIEPVDSGWLTV